MDVLIQTDAGTIILFIILGTLLGAGLLFLMQRVIFSSKFKSIEKEFERKQHEANREAESIIKSAQLEAASEVLQKKEEFTKEINEAKAELRETERRLSKREDVTEKQLELIDKRDSEIKAREQSLVQRTKNLEAKDKQLSTIITEQKSQLLKITGMAVEDAKNLLLERLENECEHEMNSLIERKIEETKEKSEEKAREIINSAIQRYAAEQTCEASVSTVDIPSDDMKGRIIGREGRNIRAFEKATGIDVIVDDTPGVIVVSGFDPVRREVARLGMERLIQDGRIHPTRIEEIVEQTRKDVQAKILQIGKSAAVEADVRGVNNKILSYIGSLQYRTSYGQNVLRHSIEVAFLAQIMAEELGLDGSIARRAGFLHDIGKAMDHEVEGGHPGIGSNYLKRFNESSIILNAVEAHHGDIPADNPYTPLVAAADAVSASRPGARRETLERYIKRLEKLEDIANGFSGVENCFAIQAGREVRVIVDAEKIDDSIATKIARDIAKKIEDEMTYPGEIKVTLLREVRCIEYAR